VAATLADAGEVLKVTGAHAIDTRQAIAAEIARPTTTEDAPTLITIAYVSTPSQNQEGEWGHRTKGGERGGCYEYRTRLTPSRRQR